MKRIAQFFKVSRNEFEKALPEQYRNDKLYESIRIPQRATTGSAGYDFFAPYPIVLQPGETAHVPTGIRVKMENGWVLMLYPRSGLGFRYRMQLNNTVGIIDSDYYDSDNEGHIQARITNDSRDGKILSIPAGTAFLQGVFTEFGITVDDAAEGVRNGGFGSTSQSAE